MPGQTIYSEEFEEYIDPIAHEKRFLGELKDIRKVTDSFDLVMFPVDARIGNGYTLGGRQFIERFKVGLFVPMHFVASGEITGQASDCFQKRSKACPMIDWSSVGIEADGCPSK